MVKPLRILLVGCERKGRPLENLCRVDYEVKKLPESCPPDELHEYAKWCDLLFIGSEKNRAYIIADEIWHLLRRKPVISLTEALLIKELRDLYPLSKVSRCYVYPDIRTEKSLFLLSLDTTFSHEDASSLKELLQKIGDSLVLGEEQLESLRSSIDRSQVAIGELINLLADSMGQDRGLIEYVIAWVLYGVGLATIRGEELPTPDPKHISPEIKTRIRQILKGIL